MNLRTQFGLTAFVLPLLCLSPPSARATFSSGLTSANDPAVQQTLSEIRRLGKISPLADHEQTEEVILKALAQAFELGELNLYDFDRLIQKRALETIMKSKLESNAVYSELLALRNIREVLEEALKAIIVKEAEDQINDGGVPDYGKHILSKIDTLRKSANEGLVDLSLEEVRFFAEDLRQFFATGNRKAFGTAEDRHANATTKQVTELRKSGIFSRYSRNHQSYHSHFSPKSGESGINVAEWMANDAQNIQKELQNSLSPDRAPNQEPEFKIYPTAGKPGNISGSFFPDGVWAITFDDGPAKTTPGVFENLKKHELQSTFFMLSQQIEKSPTFQGYAKEEMNEFQQPGCHSYSHPQIPKLSSKEQYKEIEGAAQIYERVLGVRPRYFRLPYGAGISVAAVREKIAKSCMVHVSWNVDSLDWQDKNPQSIKERTVKQIEHLGHGVILFHDIHPQSVIASEMIMTYFQKLQKEEPEKKIRLVTIPEIADEMNGGKEWACEVTEEWKKGL